VKAVFHPKATEEFIEASLFYGRQVPGLGGAFVTEVERSVKLLVDQPEIGQIIDAELRRLVLYRFPYSLIYSIERNKIWIVAVAHQRRRPGYWRARLDR